MKENFKPDTFPEFMKWASPYNYLSYSFTDKSLSLIDFHYLKYQEYLEIFRREVEKDSKK